MKTNETSSLIMALSIEPQGLGDLMASCPDRAWSQIYDSLSILEKSGMVKRPSVGSYQYQLTLPGVARKRELSLKHLVRQHIEQSV